MARSARSARPHLGFFVHGILVRIVYKWDIYRNFHGILLGFHEKSMGFSLWKFNRAMENGHLWVCYLSNMAIFSIYM